MKYFFSPFFVASLLLSCSPGNQQEEVIERPEPVAADTSAAIPPYIPQTTNLYTLDSMLQDFPKSWVEVETGAEKHTYTDYCGMAHPSLTLTRYENYWEILTIYGTDGELWELIEMTSRDQFTNGQEIREGEFVVRKISYPDDEIYNTSYFWNKSAGFCTFGEFFHEKATFADSSLMHTFIVVEEPCNL